MRGLEKSDATLCISIKAQQFVFWYDPDKLERVDKYFSISDAYLAWDHQGITAFIVYAYFKSASFTGHAYLDPGAAKLALQQVNQSTQTWLALRCYPAALVETFSLREKPEAEKHPSAPGS